MEMLYRILMANHEIPQQSANKITLKMKIQVHILSIVIKNVVKVLPDWNIVSKPVHLILLFVQTP